MPGPVYTMWANTNSGDSWGVFPCFWQIYHGFWQLPYFPCLSQGRLLLPLLILPLLHIDPTLFLTVLLPPAVLFWVFRCHDLKVEGASESPIGFIKSWLLGFFFFPRAWFSESGWGPRLCFSCTFLDEASGEKDNLRWWIHAMDSRKDLGEELLPLPHCHLPSAISCHQLPAGHSGLPRTESQTG